MPDTQWPTFMVFEQEAEDKPHQHAGTVHAPDAEMALLNARDVFVRRPQVCSLWVVREDAIYARTVQELASPDWQNEPAPTDTSVELYYVFHKLDQKGPCVYAGQVEAADPPHAMQAALETYPRPDALWWWVVPARAIHKSTPDDADSMFEPAGQKYFRHQTQFTNLMLLRKMTDDWRRREEQE